MSVISEQKSQLAKLMATENLRVEHQKIPTAKFDPQNRVLYLPIWQDMSGVMYDLLCGHEVGHALYTPADGWHDAVVDRNKGKNYKGFLNVVEDARIEKKIKRRYPGLKNAFQNAYKELMVRDFFGIKDKNINELPFIDRLNLFSKSQYTMTSIRFSAIEELFVRRAQDLETWEDVLKLTDEIYAYSKDEQSEMQEVLSDFVMDDSGESGDSDEYDEYDSGDSTDEEPNQDSDTDGDDGEESDQEDDKETKSKGKPSDEESDVDFDEETDEFGDRYNREKESAPSKGDQYNPVCRTDEAYREKEILLVDVKSLDYVYIDIPKPILSNIITPAKRVHELYSDEFNRMIQQQYFSQTDVNQWVNEFKNKNDRYISLLAKEFEMRKAAKTFSKSKLADTGDIDINKLAGYKFDDNIFRKVMLVPKGKKHGLVLLLDKSGSMSDNMAGSIEQILVLSMFCRKVNIPFIVYGFGDEEEVYYLDRNTNSDVALSNDWRMKNYFSFSQELGEIEMGSVRLREYLNSKMSNVEFSKALRNMILVKKSYEGNRWTRGVPRPVSESLSNTPMIQAIVASAEIMNKFKKENNLDLTSLVIVHDGDADSTSSYYVEREMTQRNFNGDLETKMKKVAQSYYSKYNVVVVRDKKNHFEKQMNGNGRWVDLSPTILEWFRKTTGSKIFGFYLSANKAKYAIYSKYRDKNGNDLTGLRKQNYEAAEVVVKELMKRFRNEKFLPLNSNGYDEFFLVSGGEELKIEEDQIEIDGKVTASKLKNAFMKFNKKKAVNRVLVSKFIQGIAVA